jgi:hypothetical protein
MTLNMWSPPSDEDANVITKSVRNAAHAAQNEFDRLYWLIRSRPGLRRDSSVRSVCAARSPLGVHSPYRLRIFATTGHFVSRERGLWRCTLRVQSGAELGAGGDCMSYFPRFGHGCFVSDGAIIRAREALTASRASSRGHGYSTRLAVGDRLCAAHYGEASITSIFPNPARRPPAPLVVDQRPRTHSGSELEHRRCGDQNSCQDKSYRLEDNC